MPNKKRILPDHLGKFLRNALIGLAWVICSLLNQSQQSEKPRPLIGYPWADLESREVYPHQEPQQRLYCGSGMSQRGGDVVQTENVPLHHPKEKDVIIADILWSIASHLCLLIEFSRGYPHNSLQSKIANQFNSKGDQGRRLLK